MTGLAPAVILWLLTIVGVVAACTDWGDENDGAVDEHGRRVVPGEDVREVGLP